MRTHPLVIVDGVRTPFCKMGTDLAGVDAEELGRIAVNALLSETGIDPGIVDEVIFGCVGQPPHAPNLARVIALNAGLPNSVRAVTVQRNCASGFEALTQAAEKLAAGSGEVFIVGGAESMSRAPFLFSDRARKNWTQLFKQRSLGGRLSAMRRFRGNDFVPRPALKLALQDPICGLAMGDTAEVLARDFKITRDQQDHFALQSHARALAAQEKLAEEIRPVFPGLGVKDLVERDNGVRTPDQLKKIGRLRPVFDTRTGSVTAGNASQITDGAVALLVVSEAVAEKYDLPVLGTLREWHYSGCEPERMGLGPVYAIHEVLRKTGIALSDIDLVEVNEAFAVQLLAVAQALESQAFARNHLGQDRAVGSLDTDRLNVNGGAIALGHPVGATGARLALTTLKELHRRGQNRALVSACIGGGQGAALYLERNPS
ncbi:MAG: thiolase family protein [Verrucomicrobiota bacterium]